MAGLATHDFYGGDFDGRGWLSSFGPAGSGPIVLEDARLELGQPLYGGMFGHFRLSPGFVVQGVELEVRRGVSEGVAGDLVARELATSFLVVPAGVPDIFRVGGASQYFDTLPFEAGIFHIGMRVLGTGGTAEIVTTSGVNGRGAPLANGNSFFHDPLSGPNYTSTQNILGSGNWDFSIGMVDEFIPEPSTIAVLGVGCVFLLRRRPRRF